MSEAPYAWRDAAQSETRPVFVRRTHLVDYWAVLMWTVMISGGFLAIYTAWWLVRAL